MKVFSGEWAEAYHEAINQSEAYKKSGARWELGKLALVLEDTGILLDLYQGNCRSASNISASDAETEADFVISGNSETWQKVLSGKLPPIMGLMSGKLKLSKGSIGKLMPFTKAAIDLVASAQHLDTEF